MKENKICDALGRECKYKDTPTFFYGFHSVGAFLECVLPPSEVMLKCPAMHKEEVDNESKESNG